MGISGKTGPSQKAAAVLFSSYRGRNMTVNFSGVFRVYITEWKTQWKMCKTQKPRFIDRVTD
jgi:hypothetical protein